MVKHNNVLPNQHFRKHWQTRVRTWLNQAGRKKARRVARVQKALKVAPRPVEGLLRPAVRCPTLRYNTKLRQGRGFTLEELKEAGIRRKEARSIGVAVDFRRRNKSLESLQLNKQRLIEYKSKLVVFPRNAKKQKKGDAPAAELSQVSQLKGIVLPVKNVAVVEAPRAVTAEEKNAKAYVTLRNKRAAQRYAGAHAKKVAAKANKEEAK